ncbi:MAG TPA: TetR/AcrR family transcriptional regulator [Bacteroidota bacterium]|nr:TetR/AcrR family transcriptional regulator [Bacteroidota bacterium]
MGIQERKEREKEHRREEIITAAQKVFFEKGLQTATVDEIAEVAELSKGTIYLYYKSKEDLYLAVMLRGKDILAEMFESIVAGSEPVLLKLVKLGEAYQEFFKKHTKYFRMFRFFENPQFHTQVTPEMNELCSQSNQRVWKSVIDLLQEGIDRGLIKSELKAPEAAVMLWSSSTSLMYRIDAECDRWKNMMGIDLEDVLLKTRRLMFEAILTQKGLREYQMLLQSESLQS